MPKDQILQNLIAFVNDHVALLDRFGLKAGSQMAAQFGQSIVNEVQKLEEPKAPEAPEV